LKKEIKIFKSFEKQEAYHLEQMMKKTIKERFIAVPQAANDFTSEKRIF
jgi:hypothetical protein